MKKFAVFAGLLMIFLIGCLGFSPNMINESFTLAGLYPKSEEDYLVQDSFPRISGSNIGISNLGASDIWWHYPIFQLGSYDQITNNIKYPDNPDEGTCMPASMCGAFYQDKEKMGPYEYGVDPVTGAPVQLKSNYPKPLEDELIDPNSGTRVGYFVTGSNLLPFETNVVNILY